MTDCRTLVGLFEVGVCGLVVVGEGEIALLKVVTERVCGIIYGEEVKDIDELPYPDYDEIKINNYKFPVLSYGKTGQSDHTNFFSMFTSRGCPFDCNFCASCVIWKKFRLHSAEYVKKHILHVKEKYGVKAIMIMDDLFTLNKSRTREIGVFLKSHSIPYRCLSRAGALDKETVDILVNTGCVEVGVGIESNSQVMLDVMNKKTTVQQNRDAIINCKEAGLSIKCFLILGTPGESKETLDETFQMFKELQPDDVDINILVLYPGTEFHDNIQNYDIVQTDKDLRDQIFKGNQLGICSATVSTSKITSKELEEYKHKFHSSFSKMRMSAT